MADKVELVPIAMGEPVESTRAFGQTLKSLTETKKQCLGCLVERHILSLFEGGIQSENGGRVR